MSSNILMRSANKKLTFSRATFFALLFGLQSQVSLAQAPIPPANNGVTLSSAQAFTFVRVQWEGGRSGFGFSGRGNGPLWAHDFPTAEQNLYTALAALTSVPLTHENKIVTLQDDEIFNFPFLYICEVGYWTLAEKESARLTEYLARGGFLIVDDFRGGYEWNNFFDQIKRVTNKNPEPIAIDHPIFHCFFDFDKVGDHAPYGGLLPRYLAIYDDKGRMVAIINHNNDIGDGWEWPENDEAFSTEAFKLGINYLIYAMTH